MNIIIQDKFLNIEECIFLIKQYEYVRRIKEEQKNPIKPFENHFYPWNHSYQGNNQGNCPVWLSKKINNLMQDIGRLNSQMKDASILKDYYLKNIVEPAFLEKES